jgi:hypothetical protein
LRELGDGGHDPLEMVPLHHLDNTFNKFFFESLFYASFRAETLVN